MDWYLDWTGIGIRIWVGTEIVIWIRTWTWIGIGIGTEIEIWTETKQNFTKAIPIKLDLTKPNFTETYIGKVNSDLNLNLNLNWNQIKFHQTKPS